MALTVSVIAFASDSLRQHFAHSADNACQRTLPPTTKRSAPYFTQSWWFARVIAASHASITSDGERPVLSEIPRQFCFFSPSYTNRSDASYPGRVNHPTLRS